MSLSDKTHLFRVKPKLSPPAYCSLHPSSESKPYNHQVRPYTLVKVYLPVVVRVRTRARPSIGSPLCVHVLASHEPPIVVGSHCIVKTRPHSNHGYQILSTSRWRYRRVRRSLSKHQSIMYNKKYTIHSSCLATTIVDCVRTSQQWRFALRFAKDWFNDNNNPAEDMEIDVHGTVFRHGKHATQIFMGLLRSAIDIFIY